MSSNLSVPEQIRQLNDARKLVLGDVKYYPNVVRGLLPIIGPNAHIELRRWGAEFLAEAFSTPALPNGEKETMQLYVLATVESLLQNEREDPQVLRSVILAAASIYPLALRWIINNGYDTVTWDKMLSIKQKILRVWEDAVPTVRISCIKFAQRVVLAQTVSTGAEFRHAGTLDVSLDKVPPSHQSLDPRNLEAEASGLLDRILGVLQESTDALVIDATLNSLSILVRTRPTTSSRIINALLGFNPLQLANSPLTPRSKVMIKSMEKTARLLLLHLTKRDPHNPIVPRIHQHVERTMHMVMEVLDDSGRNRPLEAQQHDGLDAKRQQVTESYVPRIPSLGSGPHSLADVFTLVGHDGLKSFDLSQVPAALVAKVAVTALSRLDPQLLLKAVDGVRGRLTTLANAPAPELNPNTAPLGVDDDDDDDYEPDFYQAEDTEQILNKLDGASPSLPTELTALDSTLALTSFSLPQPPQLTPEMALSAGSGTVAKVVELMKSLDEPAAKKNKAGFIRLAASSGSKDAWMTILTRLATRSTTGLDEVSVKGEGEESSRQPTLSNTIREVIYNYVMEDFRKHIDVAVSWLCEEWYNDKMQSRLGGDYPKNYDKNTLRLINGFLPYLHPQDKVLTRFLSEIPELNRAMLSRVKDMCRDPSVTQLALTSLLYLAMMRPPVKEMALDTVQDIWTEFEDARPIAGKYLSKYRPGFVEAAEAKTTRDGAGAGLEFSGTAIAT
ncbi:mRNA cleavage and polyadenylation specificity factor complex subunit [Metarhizium album ARSEF 1941]|uniref:mRNA cleavage and polyadenylation specificity factor complex subunit n=1 Tax=Metarhizium album (strain ARSEF 1941) TaxID=1081103 RepID=A0A0B2X3X5_METAS|nr:mRNA cleavage and polyadenylation specificity factor complex subunit [Metarhizium album ARSEF 1941]KHO00130.1 mRNA cleavage and polyadenylation specificity factor complex subunit [Metarhizium album ARSEF 1941]